MNDSPASRPHQQAPASDDLSTSGMIPLAISTPMVNVLRFILIEYITFKLLDFSVERIAAHVAERRARKGSKVKFRDGWASFFLIPYRIHEPTRLRAALPWILVVILNAFILAIEFGFSSTALQVDFSKSMQEVSTETLGNSIPPEGISSLRWIDRMQKLHDHCVERDCLVVNAWDGFVLDESIYAKSMGILHNKTLCGNNRRVRSKMLRHVQFKLSFSGLGPDDTDEPFMFTCANLTILRVTKGKNQFGFRGGDIDIDVRGVLDLSLETYNQRDYSFNVFGSCTGDEARNNTRFPQDAISDPTVYCYLSDGGRNRFIIPGNISKDTSEIKYLHSAAEGKGLNLISTKSSFRAEFQEGAPKDGDHLAAIKSLTVSFGSTGVKHDTTISLVLSTVTRTVCAASLFGATSLRNESMLISNRNAERATVSIWALVLFCVIITVLSGLSATLFFSSKRNTRWTAPISFNAVAQMAMAENCHKHTGKYLVCGLHNGERKPYLHYGPMDSADTAVKIDDDEGPTDTAKKTYDSDGWMDSADAVDDDE